MSKNTKIILIIVAIVVLAIALFFPYEKGEQEPIQLKTFNCSDVSENQENDSSLIKISCKKYQELIQSEEKDLILIARPTCGACNYFTPILDEIVKEYGITINYFNTDALSKEEVTDFYNSSTLFQSSQFGTPTLLVVKNKKIINYHIGYMEKNDAIEWFKEVGFIDNEK